ncbi:MAG: sigma-70 family RNA polymerase sigma factor [Cyanobacteria bacterium P01_A01_bin.105]
MTTSQDDPRQLAVAACQHRAGSPQRQRYLTELIRRVKPNLWRDRNPYYQDALQLTWIYLCQNLCEARTAAAPYDPRVASVATWLNTYLKYRLKDLEIAAQQERRRYVSASDRTGDTPSVLETIPARPDIPPILERVQEWLENNADEFRAIHVTHHPAINCYVMISKRLPPETPWQTLAQEFGVSYKTLESFYRRQCRPRLLAFGRAEGHLGP